MAAIHKEYKSISEFLKYLEGTPTNPGLQHSFLLSKKTTDISWYKTSNYEEAIKLLTGGWDEMAKQIEGKLQLSKKDFAVKTTRRSTYDVVGGNVSVPRLLQGVPTSMINQKIVAQKQKVITIVKHIGYLVDVSANEVIENSIKALQIVERIEASGIRVNLDVISPVDMHGQILTCRVRVKSANERLNISKVAFPMVHPSMLRRMIFRWREVESGLTKSSINSMRNGMYGCSIYDRNTVKSFLKKGEYYLHNFIGDIETEINNMQIL